MDPNGLDALVAERAIRDVVMRYCRGIDRRQFELVRDSGRTRARCETYAVASHRIGPRDTEPVGDHVVGLRYVDDFEQRDGRWRIANRVCVFDWTRTDPVAGWQFTDAFRRGRSDGEDVVFAPSLRDVIDPGGATR